MRNWHLEKILKVFEKLMKFCWKFKKIIEEEIYENIYKIWKNLLKNSW